MTHLTAASASRSSAMAIVARLRGWLDAVSYSLLAIPLRAAVATVFWKSGTAKLANWETTVYLFVDEYKLPFIPPQSAAFLAAAIELATPILLVLGLLTRPAAVVLLAMTAVIQIFVYPMAWPTHLQWAAMLLVLLCRGPGKISLDHLLLLFGSGASGFDGSSVGRRAGK